MILLRLLNPQGIAGLAASLCLAVLLVIQKGETRHWRKQSGQFEQLYQREQSAFSGTVANYRSAAAQAFADDKANAARVRTEQTAINHRSNDAFETRIADARTRAQRLRGGTGVPAADTSPGGATSVPGLSSAPGGAAQAASQDRLLPQDALTATEQAIQLDELIKWVRNQAKVDNSPADAATPHRH